MVWIAPGCESYSQFESAPGGQLFRQPDCGQHARWIGDAFARDVISRAVVGRGADERQTQRPVHAGFKRNHFQRAKPLVVIHGHHRVKIAAIRAVKQRVRRHRPDNIKLAALHGAHRRVDDGLLFVADFAAFARVRIQSANADARTRQTEVAAGLGGQLNGGFDFNAGQFFRDGFERHVRGGQRHAQPAPTVIVAEQHHRGFVCAREFGQKLRLAREV